MGLLARISRFSRRTFLSASGLACGVLVAGTMRCVASSAEAAPPARAVPGHDEVRGAAGGPGGTPVLLELFTSEGCSSCPSADDVAARIGRAQPVPGAFVVVLAHHVDYWNQLGWPDPYSSPSASGRQRAYGPLGGGNYTPQAVIDGRAEMVGSRAGAVEQAIAASAKLPHAQVTLAIVSASAGIFDVTTRVGALPPGAADDAEIFLAVVQDRGRVAVPRGENGGKTLEHTAIVRSLKALGPAPRGGGSGRTTVALPAIVAAPDGSTFSVVAFVQERSSRRIAGTAAMRLAAP